MGSSYSRQGDEEQVQRDPASPRRAEEPEQGPVLTPHHRDIINWITEFLAANNELDVLKAVVDRFGAEDLADNEAAHRRIALTTFPELVRLGHLGRAAVVFRDVLGAAPPAELRKQALALERELTLRAVLEDVESGDAASARTCIDTLLDSHNPGPLGWHASKAGQRKALLRLVDAAGDGKRLATERGKLHVMDDEDVEAALTDLLTSIADSLPTPVLDQVHQDWAAGRYYPGALGTAEALRSAFDGTQHEWESMLDGTHADVNMADAPAAVPSGDVGDGDVGGGDDNDDDDARGSSDSESSEASVSDHAAKPSPPPRRVLRRRGTSTAATAAVVPEARATRGVKRKRAVASDQSDGDADVESPLHIDDASSSDDAAPAAAASLRGARRDLARSVGQDPLQDALAAVPTTRAAKRHRTLARDPRAQTLQFDTPAADDDDAAPPADDSPVTSDDDGDDGDDDAYKPRLRRRGISKDDAKARISTRSISRDDDDDDDDDEVTSVDEDKPAPRAASRRGVHRGPSTTTPVSTPRKKSAVLTPAGKLTPVRYSAPAPLKTPTRTPPRRRTSVAASPRFRPDSGRAKRVRWTNDEVEALVQGVAKHGVGMWAEIRDDPTLTFAARRTNVDLKDKWRHVKREVLKGA